MIVARTHCTVWLDREYEGFIRNILAETVICGRLDAAKNVALCSAGKFVVPDSVRVLDILKSARAINRRTWCGESDQIERAFAEAATHKPNMLVVLGGDGTIRTAAEACTGTDTYLLPHRGGTRHMLPRALYGDVSWQDALKTTLADSMWRTPPN